MNDFIIGVENQFGSEQSVEKELIRVRNLTKFYSKEKALDDISLDIKAGRIVGLCGPNGSGKTTFIKVLVGLLRDYEGDIQIDDKHVGYESLASISYLPDRTYFEKNMQGTECILLFKDMYDDFNEERMLKLCESFEVSPKKTFKEMSKGMQEKFQLALVLSRDAKIYLLDEPIGGVDPASREKILNTILNSYAKDSLLLISTHLIADIENILDEVIFLKNGKVALFDNCDNLRDQYHMSVDAYFREVFR